MSWSDPDELLVEEDVLFHPIEPSTRLVAMMLSSLLPGFARLVGLGTPLLLDTPPGLVFRAF